MANSCHGIPLCWCLSMSSSAFGGCISLLPLSLVAAAHSGAMEVAWRLLLAGVNPALDWLLANAGSPLLDQPNAFSPKPAYTPQRPAPLSPMPGGPSNWGSAIVAGAGGPASPSEISAADFSPLGANMAALQGGLGLGHSPYQSPVGHGSTQPGRESSSMVLLQACCQGGRVAKIADGRRRRHSLMMACPDTSTGLSWQGCQESLSSHALEDSCG